MWKTEEGSTGRLIQLCIGYFFFYVIYATVVKYFTENSSGSINMNQMEYLVYSTIGGMSIAMFIVFLKRWYKLKSNRIITLGKISFPEEVKYIIPSGIMTAVIIPTTTLLFTFQMSVMVAMIIMRASIIIISRAVDSIQIAQGILHKKVYKEENIAVIFALLALSVNFFWVKTGDFAVLTNTAVVTILLIYIAAYSFRLYIMNYFKNTRAKGVPLHNEGFFGIEQISAFFAVTIFGTGLFFFSRWFDWDIQQLTLFRDSIVNPNPIWGWAIISGFAFGIVAFFSVFLFMFKGRTATFAGLVNRLTSLVAGTIATLITYLLFGGRFPKASDWISLGFIFIAIAFLSIAERKRTIELKLEGELNINISNKSV